MGLISQDNVIAGFVMERRELLHLRTKLMYVIKHEPEGPEKEAILDVIEESIVGCTDRVNLLTYLRKS